MSFGKNQPLKRILLDQGHCHIVCRPTEVCYLNSEADNTRVFLADGTWGSIDNSLIEMESVLRSSKGLVLPGQPAEPYKR